MDATQTPEEWRPVVGREGKYEVSDLGRVRSLDGAHGGRKGRVLRPAPSGVGHLHVVLAGKVTRTVHSLVAEAFLGPRAPGIETRHISGDPADCRVVNLEYGTRSDNAEDSKRHGTHFHAGLTHCKRGHELTDENLQKIAKGDRRICLACRRERQRVYDQGHQLVPDGFCPKGHPKTPENRYTNGARSTRCKPCARERQSA